ncbi:MAG: CotH kinase family protein, partial [Bacteroidota bacterium]
LVFDLFQKMGRYAPRTRFCELVLDGEYLGVYTLQEKVKRDKNRVKIDKLLPNEVSFPSLSGGYIYEINNTGSAFDWTSNFNPINDATTEYNVEFRVVYPDRDVIPLAQLNYIRSFTDSFEMALASDQYQDSLLGYRAFADVYSFIDFMLISEFAANYDTYGRSFFLVKENQNDGGKLKAGPPWDFDQGFGYYWPSPQGWVWEITNYYWPFPFWWSKFWSDELFRRETECRWKSYRQEALSNSMIQQTIDSLQLRLSSAIVRNEFLWPSSNGTTYQDNINNLETWITQRLTWIDDSLDQYNMVFPTLPNLNDTIICAGDSLDFGLPVTYSYDWDPGPKNQVLVPTESGFYTLTATDTLGCFSRKTLQIEARKPNVNFNIQLVDGNHEVNCLAIDTTLSYYFWTIGNDTLQGGWTLPYSFDQNGFYNISLSSIDSTGCSWSESQIHWVNTAMVPENGFLVFPNPCKTSFWLVVSNELIGKPFAIIDGFGKQISQGIITNIQQQIDFRLASGLYLIKIDDNVSRLVVE